MTIEKIPLEDFQAALRAQGVSDPIHHAVVCPMCKFVQSAQSLINAGAGKTREEVGGKLGFSCVGRFMSSLPPRRRPDNKPCNWTLGGLLSMHEVVIVTPDGVEHPRFRAATPEQAQALEAKHTEGRANAST